MAITGMPIILMVLVVRWAMAWQVAQLAKVANLPPESSPANSFRRDIMARWVVIFDDTEAMLAVRKEREPAHLQYLAAHSDKIRIAGGLRPLPGEPFVGGLWVVEADSRDDVRILVEQDPYYEPSCRQYRILTWGKAIDKPVTL